MQKKLCNLVLIAALVFSQNALADAGHEHGAHAAIIQKNTVKFELLPNAPLAVGKSVQVTARLTSITDGKAITFDDLSVAHTKKFHLLVIDPSLTDYQHIHPVAGKKAGEFVFDFTPLKNGSYRAWADIVPTSTGKQEYVVADMGTPTAKSTPIDKKINTVSVVDGYTFTLAFEGEPKMRAPIMASMTVTKDGKPFNQLEPVLGTFAHVVAFSEDYQSVLHIHPLGAEPKSDADRGGPTMQFHIVPEKAAFAKLFAQVLIGGKHIFVPFGVVIKP